MPTYEYVCSACHNAWELEQSIKENAITECPACHQQTAKRQISRGGGFILKGGGWYADLYSSSSNKDSGSKTESKAATSTDASSSSGSSTSTSSASSSTSSDSGSSGGSTSTGGSTPAAS